MGIARAIERVKRQAKSGGLQGVIAGLGKELRSEQIPVPLRAAAHRIARLLPAERGRAGGGVNNQREPAQSSALHAKTIHAGVTPTAVTPTVVIPKAVAPKAVVTAVEAAPLEEFVATASAGPREGASPTGTDSGAEPGPIEPDGDVPVDAEAVGATPIVNASPIEVAPIDASPIEVAPIDASPIEIESATHNPIIPQIEPDDVTVTPPKPKASKAARLADSADDVAAATSIEKPEEELATGGEEAKNLARSTPRRAKKRTGSKGNTTSKKK